MVTPRNTRTAWRTLAAALAGAVVLLAMLLLGLAAGESAVAGADGPSAASASATKTVTIKGFSFKPGTLTVARGTRVGFKNTSGEAHTATRGGAFDTKRIAPGKTAFVRFAQRGSFAYHCKIHPFMKGKIVVE